MVHNGHAQDRARRIEVLLCCLATLSLLLSACAGQATHKTYRIGILSGLDYFVDAVDSFKARMTELGYVEGQDVVYDIRKTNFDVAMYQSVLKQFVADKVDLIFVFPTEAAIEAKLATKGTNIPVVFAFVFTEGSDLVQSKAEPGGNITGVRFPGPDIALRRLEVMREIMPDVKRIWIPYQRDYPTVPSQLAVLHPAAAAAGITLIEAPASAAAEIEADLQARASTVDPRLDAILFLAEPLSVTPDVFAAVAKFSAEHKVPIGGAIVTAEDYGSVFGVNVNSATTGKQAALLADKILKGTSAGTIPVASAETFLQINYKVAQQLGLTMPDGLLRQADEVIR